MSNQAYDNIIMKLEEELTFLKSQIPNVLYLTEKAMVLCKSVIQEIREDVIINGFKTKEDEIYFFKQVKPTVNSKLIFYIRLFEIESHRTDATNRIQIDYLKEQSRRIHQYFRENLGFCQYYWRKQTYLDHIYFVRGSSNIRIHSDNLTNLVDPNFSTAYDQTVANIIACQQLAKYIENELLKLKKGKGVQHSDENYFNSTAQWNGTDTEMVELAYALVGAQMIKDNKGNISIKRLMMLLEKLFNYKVAGFYQVFSEIQKRKKDRTVFLNKLINSLISRMDKLDE